MLKKQNRKKVLYIIVSLLITMALSVGFSAFQKDLKVEDLLMHVRLQRDTRVSNKTVQRANGAVSNVDDYNVSKIYGNVSFDNTSSYILYKVSLTNYGNVKMGLLDVESNTSGVNYSLCDSNGNNCTSDFKTEICDNNSCTLGASTDIYVKVTANSAGAKNIDLDLDFEPYNDIEYINLHEEPVDFPFEIMSSDSFEITLTSKPEVVEVTGNATVNYNKNTGVLRVSAVDSDLTITAKYLATSVAETIYEGSYPSNFVRFNNTLYRIVTKENVSDGYGNTELRAKIISDSSIGDYVFSECLFSVTDSSIFRNTLSDYYDNLDENSVDLIEYAEFLAGYPMYFGLLSMNDLSNNSVNWLPQNTFTLTIYGEEVTKNFNYNKYYKIVLDDQKTKNDYYAKKTATVCSEPSSVYANINGVLTNTTVNTSMPTYPVTYLKKDVLIVDGTGTPTNPFILELSSDGLQPNPTRIEGRELTANGSYQNLVTVTNQQGVPYFSTSTPLNSSNYSSSGSTSIPTGRAVDYYNIWYYIPAIGNFKAKAGKVNTHIAGIKYTINYSKGTNVNSIEKTSDECTTYGNFMSCTVTLPSITPNDGYGNGKWSDGTNLYNPGDSYTLSSNGTTLTAQATGNTYTATFYYWNGTQIATTTSQCTVSSGSTCAVTIPNAVSNSTGKYTGTYRGVNTAFSDLTMSSLVLNNDTNYYATYTKAVTDYYYNGTQYAAVNLYRNEYFTAVDTISASLATLQTSIININEPTNGPGGSEWYGFSTAQDINIEYDSVEEAANSTSANLYSVYEFSATFAAGTGIASVSTSHKECYVVETSTSCSITPPTVTLQNGYTNPKWTQSGTGTIYSISDPIVINTNGYTYTASGVIANYQNTTTNTSYVTLNEAFNAVANNQTIKVLQNTNETTMATLASGKIGIKLDLNGKTINSTATTALTNNGELDIYNTSSTTGKIYGSRTNVIYNTGTLTFNKTASTNKVTIYDDDNGSVTNVLLNYGGSVTVNTNGTLYGYVSGVTNENNGTITISGGKISSQGYKVVTNNSGRISLLSGRIECVSVADCNDAIINYSTLSDSITISGGTITSDVNMISNESSGGVTVSSGSHYGTIENKSTGTINITNISMTGDIYNNTDGTVNINGATIDTDDCCGNNEITNRGTMNIISGTITGRFNVINLIAGTLTLGTNDSTVSTTSPLIQTDGSNNGYGIKISQTNNPTFNFYDGIIKSGNGSGYAINSVPDNTPSGYQVVKEVNNGIESAYLDSKSYLMASDQNDAYSYYLGTQIPKNDIRRLVFTNSISGHTPNGTNCWDVSENQDGSVLMWISDANNKELTIGSEGKVYAHNAAYQFAALTGLESITGMQYFDTSDVTNMEGMFMGTVSLRSLDLSYFDTRKVTNMKSMFRAEDSTLGSHATYLTSLDLTSFDTSNVTNMAGMFKAQYSLSSINFGTFNTSKVTDMSEMFAFDESLQTLDLSTFNTSLVTDMSYMFYQTIDLKTVYASNNFVTTNVNAYEDMFLKAYSILGSQGTGYDVNHTDKSYAHIDGGTSNPGYFTLAGTARFVASFTYNSNTTLGGYAKTVKSVACTPSQGQTSCTVSVPSVVSSSVGQYNGTYKGVSTSIDSMSNSSLTISGNTNFYAFYSSPFTVYYPNSTTTRTSITYYRNEMITNGSYSMKIVISDSQTSNTLATFNHPLSGYSLYGFANNPGTNTKVSSDLYGLGTSNYSVAYAIYRTGKTATIYYNSSSNNTSVTVSTATTSTAYQYVRCTNAAAEISNTTYTIPGSVTSSHGLGGTSFAGVAGSVNSMSSSNTTAYTTLYAYYRTSNITNYYYNGAQYTNRSLYRNSVFTSTTAMKNVLSTNQSGTTNISTETGPGSSAWAGYSTTQDTTTEYSTLQNAANSSAQTLYSVYQFNANFAAGTGIASVALNSRSCKVTTSSTSCSITPPTVTLQSGYMNPIWTESGTGTTYAISDPITVSTTNNTYTASAVAANYQNTTTNAYYTSLNDAFSAVASNQTIKVLQNVTESSSSTLDASKTGVILDLNGKTISDCYLFIQGELDIYSSSGNGVVENTNRVLAVVLNGNVTINKTSSVNTVTIKNADIGVISVISSNASLALYSNVIVTSTITSNSVNPLIYNNGHMIIDGATITSSYTEGIELNSSSATLNMISGEITTRRYAIFNTKSTVNNAITVSGGTISSTSSAGYAIWLKQCGGMNMTGGNISGLYGIDLNDATLNLTGGTINTIDNSLRMQNGTVNITGTNLTSSNENVVQLYSGTLTIGTNDSTISTTSPVIQSNSGNSTYGVDADASATFNFYDGIIKSASGNGYAISRNPDNIPSGYQVVKEVNNGIESAYLAKTVTATFYYNSNTTSGSLTASSTTETCTTTSAGTCTVTVPSVVSNSVGKYNSAYKGVSSSTSSMGTTSLTISNDTTYYANYSTPVTVYYPTSTTARSSTTYYRNEYFTSNSAMSSVIASTNTGTTNASITSQVSGYSIYGFSDQYGTNNMNNITSVALLASSDYTTVYEVLRKSVTANYYYNSNTTVGSLSVSSITANGYQYIRCTSSAAEIDDGTIEIPSVVTSSVGKYNSPYKGVSSILNSMTSDFSTTANTTYYAIYSGDVSVIRPTSDSSRSAYPFYRNEYFTSVTAMSAVIAANDWTSTNFEFTSLVSGYDIYGYATTAGNNTITYATTEALAASSTTTAYTVLRRSVDATFYYNSNTTAGSLTVGTATASGNQYIRCTSTAAEISNGAISTPSEVTGSVGKQNSDYKSVINTASSMSSVNPTTGYTTYYANYSKGVTNYYYSGGYTDRTLYRNEFFTSNSAMGARLATENNTTDNYTTATGPNSSVWSGLSTGQDTTAEYSSVQNAADSSSATLYTVYQYNVTYAKGSNVNNIGATSGNCKITTSSTSCNVTLPSITPASGYISAGWNTAKDASSGTSPGSNYSISENNVKLYGNAKMKTTTLSWTTGCNASGLLAKCYTDSKSVPSGYTSPMSISITWTNSSISNAGEGNGVVFAQYSKDNGSTWTNFQIDGGRNDYAVGWGYYVNYGASSTTRPAKSLPTGITHIRLGMSSNAYAYQTASVSLGGGSAVIQGP